MRRVSFELNSDSRVFWSAFIFSAICYFVFLAFRGFGWEGDSLGSASQFMRLINPNIYPIREPSMSTVPKFLATILFGFVYKIFGSFYALTVISIFLNSIMVAIISKWIYQLKGHWLVSLVAIMLNITWYFEVLGCDNPAFSIPFIVIGLYLYFQKSFKMRGAFCILIGALFRPGPELVLLFLIIYELWRKNFKLGFLSILFVLSIANLLYGYKLGFATYQDMMRCVNLEVLLPNGSLLERFTKSIEVYLKGIVGNIKVSGISYLLVIPAVFGIIECFRSRNSMRFLILLATISFIIPATTFFCNGVTALWAYYTEPLIIIQVFAGFFRFENLLSINNRRRKVCSCLLVFACLITVITTARRHKGYYETNPINGTGFYKNLGLTQARNAIKPKLKNDFYKVLVEYKDLLWIVLDFGDRAKSITVVNDSEHFKRFNLNDYDIIEVPKYFISSANVDDKVFMITDSGVSRVMYVRRSFLKNE